MQSIQFTFAAVVVFAFLFFIASPVINVLLQQQRLQSFSREGTANRSESDDLQFLQSLLPARTDGDQCHSRLQHHRYRRKVSNYKASEYLIQRLRRYEELHANCAHEAESFRNVLQSPYAANLNGSKCQSVVWVSNCGLGNKMISMAATFLYAMLTNRVFLIDRGTDMQQLFCEPFPTGSWLLPEAFPHEWLLELNEESPYRLGNLISTAAGEKCFLEVMANITNLPMIIYANLMHTYNSHDMKFFCEAEQELLRSHPIPWLFIKSNMYFVPGLYFVPSFKAELEKLFPQQEAIFHHLGRYLLNPSNAVWGRTTRFYNTYLADAENVVGLQVRLLYSDARETYSSKVFQCVVERNILPNVTSVEDVRSDGVTKKSIAAVITSLDQFYFDRLRDLFVEYSTEDGSRVSIHMPSHEGWQQTDALGHDQKALMEIYLLSLCDVLVTSPMSTFGYVANGLAGLRPWRMRPIQQLESNATGHACSRVTSIDPCFLTAPSYDCDCKGGRDAKTILENLQQREDGPLGVQLKAQYSASRMPEHQHFELN